MDNEFDPEIKNWQDIDLPNSWTDKLFILRNPFKCLRLFSCIFQKRKRVELPKGLINSEVIPKYAQQEFHHLPNGNYSNRIAAGYIKGFDRAMLGEMRKSRLQIASKLKGCNSSIDIGCGGGGTAQAVYQSGVQDVWGVDISPYLLKRAATLYPKIKFIHAAAESLPFRAERFDAVSISYVLHEVPPKFVIKIIDEASRVLKSGGKLVLLEPSSIHYSSGLYCLFKEYGFKGIYFKCLAHTVHEPFVKSWHGMDIYSLLKQKGLQLVEEINEVPNHLYVFIKQV
jgi:ubiquinone/menaquinone biosynthesis C-methylase UbiE